MAHEHDTRYKKFFSHPKIVQRLLTGFVDESFIRQLDFDSLQLVDKEFISAEHKKKASDIVWRVNYKGRPVYFYILLEFQSSNEPEMALRMLHYVTFLYQYLESQTTKGEKLPAVFPLLLYNGNEKWRATTQVADLIEATLPAGYIPYFEYYAIAENRFSREALKKIRNVVSGLFYIENAGPEKLDEAEDTIVEIVKDEQPELVVALANFINNYFFKVGEAAPREIERINDILEVKTMLARTLEKRDRMLLRQGRQEGKLEGRREGRQEGRQELVLNMRR